MGRRDVSGRREGRPLCLRMPGHMMPGVIGRARRGLRGDQGMAGGVNGRSRLLGHIVHQRRTDGTGRGWLAGRTIFDFWMHDRFKGCSGGEGSLRWLKTVRDRPKAVAPCRGEISTRSALHGHVVADRLHAADVLGEFRDQGSFGVGGGFAGDDDHAIVGGDFGLERTG